MISLIVDIFVRLIKAIVCSLAWSESTDTSPALAIQDIQVLIVVSLFVQVIATMLELALLPTLVLASEAEWEPTVQLTVDVVVMEPVIRMALVFVMLDSPTTRHPESASTPASAKPVQIVMVLISYHAVQDVLVELAIMALALVGLVSVGPTVQLKCQSIMSMPT